MILTATGTSYPRLGKNSVGHDLRRARHDYDKGLKTKEEISRIEDSTVCEILEEQEKIGIDLVNDGCIRWYCPISHIAGRMGGVRKGPLHHFLVTNFHVRKAIVEELPRWKEPLVVDDFIYSRRHSIRIVSPVLTGPVTLLYYSNNLSKYSLEQVGLAYAEALAKELTLLQEAGAWFIHLDDPLILNYDQNWDYIRELYSILAGSVASSRLIVKTYGAKSCHMIPKLLELPCDTLGLDCVSDPDVPYFLRDHRLVFQVKNFALGVVDSRNSLVEDPAELAFRLESVIPLRENLVFLEPSFGLEYLPRKFARKKLETLVMLKKNLEYNLIEIKKRGWRDE